MGKKLNRAEILEEHAKNLLASKSLKDINITEEARKVIMEQGWEDYSVETLRRRLSKMFHRLLDDKSTVKETEVKPEVIVNLESKSKRLSEDKKTTDKKLKAAYDKIRELEDQVDVALKITNDPESEKLIIPKPDHNLKHPAVACVLWSDWHVEERVNPATINGANNYNAAIAEERAKKLFENTAKMIKKESHYSDITSIFIWLGGDFITGYIHEELEEENELSPLEAVRLSKKLLISGIEYVARETGINNIVVRCNWGNHGRVQKKKRVSTSYKNSYEFHMYCDLKDYFEGTEIKVLLDESRESYTTLFERYTVRTWHGDNIRYSGGVGGVTIPLKKFIMRQDQNRKADYNFIGHFHQCWQVTENCNMNGSMIGYNAYAQELGCRMEPPMQCLQMLDYHHGFYAPSMPIHCF